MIAAVRDAASGAARYLGGVLVGVLLAPVLPDVAVDAFGRDDPRWVNPVLRLAALALVLVACVAVFAVQRRRAHRRARGAVLTGIGACDVLVLPLGLNCVYRPPGQRTGLRAIPEWLIDTCEPQFVVAVASPETPDADERIGRGLAEKGIGFACVQLTDVVDPKRAVPEAARRIPEKLADLGLDGQHTYVDTTGGNVVMSLAMLRVGAMLGAECTYLSSRYEKGRLVPGTQVGRAFDPVALFAPPAADPTP